MKLKITLNWDPCLTTDKTSIFCPTAPASTSKVTGFPLPSKTPPVTEAFPILLNPPGENGETRFPPGEMFYPKSWLLQIPTHSSRKR
jgi:hypothetical protein